MMNFSLLDYRGKYYELKQTEGRAVVLFFTGNGCPIARQSISKLRSLRGKFAKQGVAFWMVDSNLQDDRKSIAEEAKEFGIGSIPILMDESQALAKTRALRDDTRNAASSGCGSTSTPVQPACSRCQVCEPSVG